jgi:hypothetical protein
MSRWATLRARVQPTLGVAVTRAFPRMPQKPSLPEAVDATLLTEAVVDDALVDKPLVDDGAATTRVTVLVVPPHAVSPTVDTAAAAIRTRTRLPTNITPPTP